MRFDGAKVEYSGALDAFANSSGGFFLDYGDDLSSRQAWYDGKEMTLLDSINNLYAMTPASGSNAAALIQVSDEHGLEMPLAPFLKRKLTDDLEALGEASYLGSTTPRVRPVTTCFFAEKVKTCRYGFRSVRKPCCANWWSLSGTSTGRRKRH